MNKNIRGGYYLVYKFSFLIQEEGKQKTNFCEALCWKFRLIIYY